jgi:pimeloyl-ACP methyl ester carboxylesterase
MRPADQGPHEARWADETIRVRVVSERGEQAQARLRSISAPTLVIWGQRDRYLGPKLAEPDREDVPNLDRVERLPDASHWVHHDEAERVTKLLVDFFAAQPGTATSPTA